MNKALFVRVVNTGLLICFLVNFATGVIKFPGISEYISLHSHDLPTAEINLIHHWFGIATGLFGFVHIALYWKVYVAMVKNYLRSS